MTIFGQNDFLESFLILVLIKLFEYYDVQSIEGYPTESFSQVETMEIRAFELSRKVVWLPWQHT